MISGEALKNIFNIPDLRKRIFFMLGMLAVYRIGAHIPTPGIDSAALAQFFANNQGTVFGFLDLFSGGSFSRLTIFALGIMPYITSSIILQLLTVVWPYLEKLSKEGELGRRKITAYTRYLTVVLALIQSAGIAIAIQNAGQFVVNPGIGFILMTMLTLTTVRGYPSRINPLWQSSLLIRSATMLFTMVSLTYSPASIRAFAAFPKEVCRAI